jgi:hypothetical protein
MKILIFIDDKYNYVSKLNSDIKYIHTDTTYIINKNGSDLNEYNPQVTKHNTSCVSYI